MILPGTGRGTDRRSRAVEGAPSPTLIDDPRDDAVQIFQHLDRGNSQCLEAPPLEVPVALLVALRPIAATVRLTVDLYGEARLKACKVHRITDLRKLPAELVAAGSTAELLPKEDFR